MPLRRYSARTIISSGDEAVAVAPPPDSVRLVGAAAATDSPGAVGLTHHAKEVLMNTASSARAMLIVAFFGAGAVSTFAADSSCLSCHTNTTTMQRLVAPPVIGSDEGEG